MTPTKHGRTPCADDNDRTTISSSVNTNTGGGARTGGESPSKRARSVTGAAAAASRSQYMYAALTGAPSMDVVDSANLCGAAGGGLSSVILCCTGGVGAGTGAANTNNASTSRAVSLPIPAVMTNHSMGSLGGMADLLLEEESTHGRRGVDQACSNVTDGKPSPQRRQRQLSPRHQSSLADVSTMSATLGEDMKMLEEARRGSCSGNLRRLGSSSLAQSRAGSFLADMDEEEDYLGTGGRAEAAEDVGGSGSIGSFAEEKKEAESISSRGGSANQPTEKRKLVRKQSAGSKIKGRIRSAFGGKNNNSGSGTGVGNGKVSSKDGDADGEMEQSLGSCGASVRTDTDGAGSSITGRTSDIGSIDHASAGAHGSTSEAARLSPPAAMTPNIPLIDAASTSYGASGSYSFDLNDLDKHKSIDAAAAAEPPAQYVFGPPLGSFLDVRGPIDGSAGAVISRKELVGTYSTYRMDPFYVHHVVAHMDTMLPLHHHENSLAGSKMWDSISDLSNMRNCCQNADIGKTVKNVCSEPAASSIKVRGGSYLKDSVKVGSAESMFSVLGVDIVSNSSGGDGSSGGGVQHCSARKGSYLNRLRAVCQASGLEVPFLLVINFVLPFGNLLAYHYRPDGTNGGPINVERQGSVPAERLWRKFLEGDKAYRDKRLKFVPRMVEAPWMVKKMVGSAPALIAQKLPTTYYGSIQENYLEISLDVTAGPAIANTIATTVAGKSDAVTVDLAFLIEGLVDDEELPEQILALYRLHHVNMKKTLNTEKKWAEEIKERQLLRMPDNDGVEML